MESVGGARLGWTVVAQIEANEPGLSLGLEHAADSSGGPQQRGDAEAFTHYVNSGGGSMQSAAEDGTVAGLDPGVLWHPSSAIGLDDVIPPSVDRLALIHGARIRCWDGRKGSVSHPMVP